MRIKTYIINLKDSLERKKYILKEVSQFPCMDVEMVEGVNGKLLTEQEKETLFDRELFKDHHHRSYPLAGEIGCTLSHYKCYQRLIDSSEDYALILEDDVKFIYPKDMALFLEKAIELLKTKKPKVIISVPNCLYWSRGKELFNSYSIYSVVLAYSTCGYLINRQAAERLLDYKRPYVVADDYVFMIQNGIKVFEVYPNIMCGLSDPQINQFSSVITTEYPILGKITLRRLKYVLFNRLFLLFARIGLKTGWMKEQRTEIDSFGKLK